MKPIEEFVQTIAKLRSPNGCPWDKIQTHKTLKRYLIEEAYETIEAIDSNDPKELMEELGDVLLQVVLHSQIASDNKDFTFDDVVNHVNRKMISRHPHVFANTKVKNTDEVMVNWEEIKKQEKPGRKNIFDGIPKSLPSLLKALKVSKKAAKKGFEWSNKKELYKALKSEFNEVLETLQDNKNNNFSEELGDLLLMLVNVSRWKKTDPEESLNSAIRKFIIRFKKVEELANNNLEDLNEKELNKLWKKAKETEKIKSRGKNDKKENIKKKKSKIKK